MLSKLIDHGHSIRQVTLPEGRPALHCMAAAVGFEQRYNEAYSWDGLKRGPDPFLVIQHTLAGRGQLDFAGSRHVLAPGDTMVLSFPHANRYWLERGERWEYFWLLLNGREALRIARQVIDSAGPVLRLSPDAVDRLAAACLAVLDAGEPLPGAASAAAYAAMMALHDGAFGAASVLVATPMPAGIARAKTYIDAHLDEPLDVPRLARQARWSRAHFSRAFASATGTPPSDYVFGRRMDRAARLLVATDSPIRVIAEAAGFSNPNYFAKAFRRAYGVTPSTYRSSGATLMQPRES